MSYLVLARKYRPQTFQSILGQEHITHALVNAIARRRVPHALLLTGPRGVGKTTSARVFAKALNCTGRPLPEDLSGLSLEQLQKAVEPCGECPNCKEIAKSSSIAVWEVDGASNNSVDNVRELIDSLRSLPPPGSHYKIYIIDEVHMLSTAAFNALLKSLEEPPERVIFIFATTEPQKIPETVHSRCQRHDFRRLTREVIVAGLRDIAGEEGIDVTDDVLDFLAKKSQGGMRDAQSLFDRLSAFAGEKLDLKKAQKVFGVIDRGFYLSLGRAVLRHDAGECFRLIDEAYQQSLDLRSFVGDFLVFWRNVLLLKQCQASVTKVEKDSLLQLLDISAEELSDLSEVVSGLEPIDAQRLFDIAEETTQKALGSNFARFILEAGIAKMATLSSLRPIARILQELEGRGQVEVPTGAAMKSSAREERSAPPVEVSASFNPSWEEFLHHVRSRSELVLGAFLRRVSPRVFTRGKLELEAAAFDLASLREADTLQRLRNCLHSYSGETTWDVKFREIEKSTNPAQESVPPPGSMMAVEATAEKDRVRRIEHEARTHPSVKAALSTFEGSKIERVSPVKR